MKKLPLAAIVLLLATVLTAVYFLLESGADRKAAERATASAAGAAPVEAGGGPDSLPAPATAAETGGAPNAPAPEPTPATDGGRESVAATNRAALRGRVALPPDLPRDEALELLVFDSVGDPTREASDASDARLEQNERIVARLPLAPDGAFEVEVPTDAKHTLWVTLRARYLYLERGVRVESDALEQPIALAPKLGAWITGQCIAPLDASEAERDLSETELELGFDPLRVAGMSTGRSTGGVRQRESDCTADGRFEFRGVAGELSYWARALPPHLAAGRSEGFESAPGAHVSLELPLTRGGTLAGRIVDSAGRPVAAADLKASIDPVIFGQGGWAVREGESDAGGAFELHAVLAGKVDFEVEREGFLRYQVATEIVLGKRTDLGDVVLGSGASISGTIRWSDGAPAAEVDIDVSFDPAALAGMSAFNAMQGAEGQGQSDDQGHFSVDGLGKGPFVVSAEAAPRDAAEPLAGAAKARRWRARADHVAPGTADVELVLAAPVSLAGRVVDASGQAITKGRVSAQENLGGMFPGLGAHTETSDFADDEGRFEIGGLTLGKWEVTAIADGYTRSDAAAVTLPPAADAAPIVLVLRRGASVAGTVRALDGTPFAGAEVRLKLSLQDMLKRGGEGLVAGPRTLSDEQGRFELTNIAPGKLSFVAAAQGYATSEPLAVELAAGQELTGLELRMRLGGTLTGEIFNADGGPFAGATILVQQPASPEAQHFCTADAQGQFKVEHLEPGEWNVMSLPFDKLRDSQPAGDGEATDMLAMLGDMKLTTAKMVEGEETHVTLGAPPKNPVVVHGRVQCAGRGVPGTMITFIADGNKGLGGMKFVSTNSEGEYTLTVGEPGRFMCSVQKLGLAGQQQTVASTVDVPEVPEFEHDFALPLGAIAGRVLDADGKPAAGARVSLTADGAVPNGTLVGNHYAEITTESDGRYELLWLAPGRYSVGVGGAAFGGLFGTAASSGRQVRSGVEVGQDSRVEGVDFKLRRPGRISGVVREGADGRPVAEAAVFLRDASGRPLERFSMVTSDGSGQFTYDGLEPGVYTVLARTQTETSAESPPVNVREGAATEVTLTLATGTLLIVVLQDADGQPIDCSIEVTDERGHQVNGTMSLAEIMRAMTAGEFSSKEQRVGPLPPGRYRVIVSTSDGRSVSKPVTLTGQAERRLNVRL